MESQGQHKHLFLGGLNSDDEDRVIPLGDYRMLRNARAGFSGAVDILAGMEAVTEIQEPVCEAVWTELSRACSPAGGTLVIREIDQDFNEREREVAEPDECPYFNTEIAGLGTFLKADCGVGQLGTAALIVVPARTHTSTISQIDAQAKAQEAYDALDTQEFADANGSCVVDPAWQPSPDDCKLDSKGCWTGLLVDSEGNTRPPATLEECEFCNQQQAGKCRIIPCNLL